MQVEKTNLENSEVQFLCQENEFHFSAHSHCFHANVRSTLSRVFSVAHEHMMLYVVYHVFSTDVYALRKYESMKRVARNVVVG